MANLSHLESVRFFILSIVQMNSLHTCFYEVSTMWPLSTHGCVCEWGWGIMQSIGLSLGLMKAYMTNMITQISEFPRVLSRQWYILLYHMNTLLLPLGERLLLVVVEWKRGAK